MQTEGVAPIAGSLPVLTMPARISLIFTPWISALALSGLNPVLKPITAHFAGMPGAETLARLLVTVVSGAMVFGAPAGGLLAERFGERRVLLGALATFAVAGAIGYYIEDPRLLLATRAVLGFALGAVGVCAATILTLGVPGAQQSRWLGYYTAFATLGAVILLPVAGKLGGIDWRYVFPLHLVALPIMLAVLATVPPIHAGARRHAAASPAAPAGMPWKLVLVAIACGVIGTTLPVYLPFHLTELGAGRPEQIAGALVPMAITTGLFSLGYGWVRTRLSTAAVFAAAFLVSAVGLAIVVVAPGYEVVLAGVLFSGAGMGLLAPNLFGAAALAAAPERRARVVGVVRAAFFSAPLLAQLPLEPITAARGPAAAIAALAGFALVATAAVLLARRSFAPAAGVPA